MNGQLTVITGPMFASKSEKLIQMAANHLGRVFAIKPELDTRTGFELRSRVGTSYPARSMPVDYSFEMHTESDDLVVIDEAHMFSLTILNSIHFIRGRGTHVVAAGVDYDIKTKPFLVMAHIISRATSLIRCFSKCECGATAAYTKRLVDDDSTILVGSDQYAPICYDCLSKDPEPGTILFTPKGQ